MAIRFPQEEFARRLARVRKAASNRGIDFMIVFSSPGSMRFGQRGHVLYLTGYEPYFGNSMLILPTDKGQEPLLQIDEANHFPSECTWVSNIQNPQDPVRTIGEYFRNLKARKPSLVIVGEYSVNPKLLSRIEEMFATGVTYASDLLETERAVKSEHEIRCMKRSSAIAAKGFEAAARFIRPGVKDSEVVSEIERTCREAGSDDFPHRTMFSSGSDRSYLEWWWYCGRRTVKRGDCGTADFGTMFGAYCCDMARTFSLGSPSKAKKDIYDTIVEAEVAGQDAARAGALASEVDKAAAKVLRKFARYVTTGETTDIGHGVGLEVHEWPFVGYHHIRNDETYVDRALKENMVISIEPQIYHPDFGLMQIEDQFRVTKRGGEILTDLPREIIEAGG